MPNRTRTPNGHGLGWKPALPDKRNWRYEPPTLLDLPISVDLRPHCPPVYDQGQEGSCTANAACGAWEFDSLKQGIVTVRMSRNFAYYDARVEDGDPRSDSGSSVMGVNKGLAKWGVCPESLWPYTDADMLKHPTQEVYAAALPNAITSYATVKQDLVSLKTLLANGFPFQFGFTVYESFESNAALTTGIIPMPKGYPSVTEGILGGHAVLTVGYDDANKWFICRNSWGTGVMDQGYFYMPYQYMLDQNLSSDFWVINAVPGVTPTPQPTPPDPTPVPPTPPVHDAQAFVTWLKTLGVAFTS